jgi:hypothetical protein
VRHIKTVDSARPANRGKVTGESGATKRRPCRSAPLRKSDLRLTVVKARPIDPALVVSSPPRRRRSDHKARPIADPTARRPPKPAS